MSKLIYKKSRFQVWVFRMADRDKKISIRMPNSLKYSKWLSLSIFMWSRNIQFNFVPPPQAAKIYLWFMRRFESA